MEILIDLPFGLWIGLLVGRWKHEFSRFARWRECALIGAAWIIRLNRLSAAAMWPYLKLL